MNANTSRVGVFTPRPAIPAATHPIETTRYILVTPMVEVLEERLVEWIVTRRTGGFIYGGPRLGKTVARRYLEMALPQRFSGLRIISVPCRRVLRPSEDGFFEHWLACAGHIEPGKGKVPAKRRRLTEHLTSLSEKSGWNQLVLFADDAQRLREEEYNWLMDVGNELKEREIDLSVFFFGQPELAHQRSAFQETKKRHIIGRFMTDELVFHGLLNESDVAYCLRAYDDASEFPANSGWSFTRFFFPEAFSAEWRLTSIAADLWSTFMAVTTKHAVSRYQEVPMLFFCRTVNSILTRLGADAGVHVKISRAQLEEFILQSGFVDFHKHGVGENESQ